MKNVNFIASNVAVHLRIRGLCVLTIHEMVSMKLGTMVLMSRYLRLLDPDLE